MCTLLFHKPAPHFATYSTSFHIPNINLKGGEVASEKEETRSNIQKDRQHSAKVERYSTLSFCHLYFINHQLIPRYLEWTCSSPFSYCLHGSESPLGCTAYFPPLSSYRTHTHRLQNIQARILQPLACVSSP